MNRASDTKTRVLIAWICGPALLLVSKFAFPDAAFFTHPVGKRATELVGFVGMFAPLVVGSVYAIGAVRGLERGNPARTGWVLLAAWLTSFAIGEALLGVYTQILRVPAPVPSVGDAFFLLGYAALIAGASTFARVYLGSGLPVGPRHEPYVIAGVATPVLAAIGVVALRPIVNAPRPFGEAFVAIAYPVLDLVVLVPTAVLVRITSRFQGGRVWTVWGAILAGFVALSVADALFAYADLAGLKFLDPLLVTTFIAGYALTAYGAARQYELVGE